MRTIKHIGLISGVCAVFIFMCAGSVSAIPFWGAAEEEKKQDTQRIEDVLRLAGQVEAYREKAGHYPLVKKPQEKIVVSVIADRHDFEDMQTVPYQSLEQDMKTVLGEAFTLPQDPDGRPYQYATNGQVYYVSTFLTRPRFFARAQGRKHHKLEISNLPVTRSKQYRIQDIVYFLKNGRDDEDVQKQFYTALGEKDFTSAKAALEKGANPSPLCDFHHRCQPLATASAENDLDTMRFLIENGADLDGYNAYYDVALIYALGSGEMEAATLLVQSGANVNLPNFFGVSPFVGLAHQDAPELLKLMIDKGADLDSYYMARNAKGNVYNMRPLDAALKGQQINTIALLLEAGANPILMQDGGQALARFVKENGSTAQIALLPPSLKTSLKD